ncbi:MAG: nucleotidyltransferase domain-containing protein [Proteobacteria bacterium]|nr:MAG: nucleotidyltransferase domain-containing protein [Pseudomonadota bacterium]
MNKNKALIYYKRDPMHGLTKDELVSKLRLKLSGRVNEAYFFGSITTDEMKTTSDVDMIIVQETSLPFFERVSEFEDLYDLVPGIDLIIYTPQEFKSLVEDPTPGFWRSVARTKEKII